MVSAAWQNYNIAVFITFYSFFNFSTFLNILTGFIFFLRFLTSIDSLHSGRGTDLAPRNVSSVHSLALSPLSAIRCFALFTCFQILHKILKFCMKFGDLILGKINKFIATRSQILRLKCTKFKFGSGPDPA